MLHLYDEIFFNLFPFYFDIYYISDTMFLINKEREFRMNDTLKKLTEQLNDLDHDMAAITYMESLLGFDSMTTASKDGVFARSEVISFVSTLYFNTLINPTVDKLLHELGTISHQLDPLTQAKFQHFKREYEKISPIPVKEYADYQSLLVESSNAWEKAKKADDYNLFAPYLEKVIETTKRFINYRGYTGHPYNTLLNDYEPGATVEMLDEFFDELKASIVPLVQQIQAQPTPETSFLNTTFPIAEQEAFSLYIMEALDFRMDGGSLSESEHPFTQNMSPDDVRITTHFHEQDLINPIFSTIHETGHGLYEQNISKEIGFSCLATGVSMGIHESQSRLYENNFGRNQAFWKRHMPKLVELFPDVLGSISVETFIKAINKVEPSLIRVDADEVTYPLHIMVRYEMEKELMEHAFDINDLPKRWADKYEEYVGVRPTTDANGILQDVHWSEGLFGYFPSYALGSAYAAQFEHAMQKDLDVLDCLEEGKMEEILAWLSSHIHQYGSTQTPAKIIEGASGEAFNPKFFTDYLTKKYQSLYNLKERI